MMMFYFLEVEFQICWLRLIEMKNLLWLGLDWMTRIQQMKVLELGFHLLMLHWWIKKNRSPIMLGLILLMKIQLKKMILLLLIEKIQKLMLNYSLAPQLLEAFSFCYSIYKSLLSSSLHFAALQNLIF